MKFTKLLTSAAAIAALTFSASGAKGIEDIKSESEIFNKHFVEIKQFYNDENSNYDKDAKIDDVVLYNQVLPDAFREIIKADDSKGFASMIQVSKFLEVNLNEINNLPPLYNIIQNIIDDNAINCFNILKTTNYDFDEKIIDFSNGEKQYSIIEYAKYKKASKEMLNALTNAGIR